MSDFSSMKEVIKHLADGGIIRLSQCKSILKMEDDGWRLGALYNMGDLAAIPLSNIDRYIEPIKYEVEIFTDILPTGPALEACRLQEFLLDNAKWNDKETVAYSIRLRITVEEIQE